MHCTILQRFLGRCGLHLLSRGWKSREQRLRSGALICTVMSLAILTSCNKRDGATAARARRAGFTSTGLVAVRTDLELLRDFDPDHAVATNTAELEVEKATQVRLLVNERLISKVLQNSDAVRQTQWFKQFVKKDGGESVNITAAKSDLLDRLLVRSDPGSRLIVVEFTCDNPKDAQTIVTELVNQHIKDQEEAKTAREAEIDNRLEQLKLNS